MRGNNKGRIFMSLINHILCLFPRCLHPSCTASLPPSHFKSHSLYHFTDPSEKRRKKREIGIEKRRQSVYLFIYLFVCVSIMLFYDGLAWLTYVHEELNLHRGSSKFLFISVYQHQRLYFMSQEPLPRSTMEQNCE